MIRLSTIESRRLAVFLSAVALLAGGGMYLFFRPGEFVFHDWFSAIGLDRWLTFAGPYTRSPAGSAPDWILYSLPSGLWAFAYALIITGIWWNSRSRLKYFWIATIPILVMGFELLQGAGILRGTFSFTDLALGMTGLGLGMVIGYSFSKKKYHEKRIE